MKDKKKLLIIGGIVLFLLLIVILVVTNKKEEVKEKEEPKVVEKKKEEITITFDTDGGDLIDAMKVEKDKEIELPAAVKEGFTFLGWYKDDILIENKTKFSEDTTLKAKWEEIKEDAKTMIVTFNSNGGTAVSKITLECGKALQYPKAPTRSGYTFENWVTKKGKVVSNGSKLACEDVTLYANWKKVEEKKEEPKVEVTKPEETKKEETKKEEPKAEEPKKTEYTCPDGYTLNGTKCSISEAAKEKCPDGTKVDGNLCIKTSDNNAGTRQCKEDTVTTDGKGHTWTGKGDYHFNGAYGKCAYYKWENYTTQSQCTQAYDIYHKTTWVSDLNGCYAEDKMNNYETVCSGDYQYYSSADLSSKFGIHDNGKCLRKVEKAKYCDKEGYTLSGSNCVKTIDASQK